MTPLQRAAKAAYDRNPTVPKGARYLGDKSWDELGEFQKKAVIDGVRAALESLMEPTLEMRAAGRAVDSGAPELEPQGYNAQCIWQAMLKKVLQG